MRRHSTSLLLLACLGLQQSACVSAPADIGELNHEVPFLTTRAFEIRDDGKVVYSTTTSETSGGLCQIALSNDADDLDISNGPIGILEVEDVISRFEARADEGILVYVHGYNIGLERACRDAATLAYRTGFEDRLLLFSWPASRTLVTYRKDERRLAESMPAILDALDELGRRIGPENVNIVAHSMGSRIVTASIESTPPREKRFDDLILIAPDIDREVFVEALPELKERVQSISVVVSDSDKLLLLSQTVNLGERLGQASDLEADGVEVVDVTGLGDLGFGDHIYHLENDRVGAILKVILDTDPVAE